MPRIENDYHSTEVQDILGKPPAWVVRWGVTVIFVIFLGVLVSCYFIKYPELVKGSVEITTINPPVELIARLEGLIDTICVRNGDRVLGGELIAVLNNTADYNSIIALENLIKLSYANELSQVVVSDWIQEEYSLGTLQAIFADFQAKSLGYRQYLAASYIPNKKKLLQQQIDKNKEYYSRLEEQRQILLRDLEYEGKNKYRDSLLFRESVISEVDYQGTLRSLLSKENTLKGFEATLTSTELTILQTQQQLAELSLQELNESAEYERNITSARQQLLSQIAQWKEQYTIVSPVDGTVSLINYWSENQRITAGEKLATILPEADLQIIGRMTVPSAGFGKVKEGQMVNVRLNGFPYMEYGVLKCTVNSISAVPHMVDSNPTYLVELHFPYGLHTTYGKTLPMIHKMDGTADIITEDLRLIQRFLQPIVSLYKNN